MSTELMGEVKVFKPQGYGFVTDLEDPDQKDYFFHVNDVDESIEESDLQPGLRVTFDLVPNSRKPGELQAANLARA